MNLKTNLLSGALAAFALTGTWSAPAALYAQEPAAAAEATEDTEVLTRGPVHEAFAGTISNEAETGVIINKRPPEMIEEDPPDQQPEGDNVTWIPGYWAWDDENSEFLWISGIWRNLPPGREWVPGYWSEAEGGFQWTSGYWEDEEEEEVTYLPAPPKSLETGPTVEAASEDDVWIPGNWGWRDTRYVWRPGYWSGGRPDWVWTPSYYRHTPRGYIYVSGFWDYSVPRRGVIFAPVRFHRPVYVNAGYRHRPLTVIASTVFLNHLFVRPNYGHYYFGDYYEPAYRNRGFFASHHYYSSRRGYDPIYAHYRWQHRGDRRWEVGRREYFEMRRDRADLRPARNWAMLRDKPDRDIAERFDRYVVDKHPVSFRKVSDDDRRKFARQREEVVRFKEARKNRENNKSAARPNKEQAVSEKIERSPVKSNRSARNSGDGDNNNPPKRLENGGRKNKGDNDAADRGNKTGKPDFVEPGKGKETVDKEARDEMRDNKEKRNPDMPDNNKGDGGANKNADGNRGDGGRKKNADADRGDGAGKKNADRGDGAGKKNDNPNQGDGGGKKNADADRGDGGGKKNANPAQDDGGKKNAEPNRGDGGGKKNAEPNRGDGGGKKNANQGGGDGANRKKAAEAAPEKKKKNPEPEARRAGGGGNKASAATNRQNAANTNVAAQKANRQNVPKAKAKANGAAAVESGKKKSQEEASTAEESGKKKKKKDE